MQNFILFFLLAFAFAGCDQASGGFQKQTNQSINFINSDTMDQGEFWKLMEYASTSSNGDLRAQENLLVERLLTYSPEQIIEFEKILRHYIIESDDFKVMAAEKIIEGSVSDDPYLYFRCWLISRGQTTFEETLKNPEYLADKVNKATVTQFEALIYVATKAYMQKTGRKEEDESFPRDVAIKSGLDYDFGAPPTKGTDWTIEQLPTLYPKLWKRFR